MRECSVEILAAPSWSSQKPGSPICCSSSARRAVKASGSKVITDPVQLGPDLLELLLERLRAFLGHAPMVADAFARASALPARQLWKQRHAFGTNSMSARAT